jgi:hypothetical protein
VEVDGLHVTTLARSVTDAAARLPFEAGVALADAALRGSRGGGFSGWARVPVERAKLLTASLALPIHHGRARAARAIGFADPASESPGESLVRAALHRLGVPPPTLQVEFAGTGGARYVVDFFWPEQQFVIEFDGRAKYVDPALRNGRSVEQVVHAEKLREDDIRAQVRGFARVEWSVARSLPALAERLARAGLRW